MKKFRFVCITLAIIIIASTSPNIGLVNTKSLAAASINDEYQKLSSSSVKSASPTFPEPSYEKITGGQGKLCHDKISTSMNKLRDISSTAAKTVLEYMLILSSVGSMSKTQNNQSQSEIASDNQTSPPFNQDTSTPADDQSSQLAESQSNPESDYQSSLPADNQTTPESENQSNPLSDNQTIPPTDNQINQPSKEQQIQSENQSNPTSDNETSTPSEDQANTPPDNQINPVPEGQSGRSPEDQSDRKMITSITMVEADKDSEIKSADDNINIRIPKGAVSKRTRVELVEHTAAGSTGMRMVKLFDLNANYSDSSEKVKKFNKELTISVKHEPEELKRVDIDSLRLYYLDENSQKWIPISNSKYDRQTMTLNAAVDHLSYFGEQANPIFNGPGRITAAETDLQSGAAIFNYPIELPPGPGGFQPQLVLSYNSGVVDEMKNKRAAGSWVGIGWALHFGRIYSYTEDEQSEGGKKYYLELGNDSYRLEKLDATNYRLVPDAFWKITRNSENGNTWEAWDPDGNYYRFGGTQDSEQYIYGTPANDYYRWDLSLLRDTNNNIATVTYVRDMYNNSVRSAYPQYLTYNDNKINIQFNSSYDENAGNGPLRKDNPLLPTPVVVENQKLDSIEIKVDGTLLRKYMFTYNTTDRVISGDYGGIFYSGKHTLYSITQIGADGISQLPSMNFTYQDKETYRRVAGEPQYSGNPGNPASLVWPRLTAINSGYGGTVTFGYTQIPNTTADAIWTRQAVTTQTINSGIGPNQDFTYTYSGNPQYLGLGWDQKYRGFAQVKVTDAGGNYINHWFYTTGTVNGLNAEKLADQEYKTQWCDSTGQVLREELYDWAYLQSGLTSSLVPSPIYWGKHGSGDGQLNNPVPNLTSGIAISTESTHKYLYLGDSGSRQIKKFWINGNYYDYVNQLGIYDPSGIAISSEGGHKYIYVVDSSNNRVQKFWINGNYYDCVNQWGSYGSGNGQFNNPCGIAISIEDYHTYLYVVDSGNNRVQKFDTSGVYVTQFGAAGSGNGQFDNPSGIAVSVENNDTYLYVVDSGNNRVQKFWVSSYYNYVGQFGQYGTGNGQFQKPSAIAVSVENNDRYLYVVDSGNNRVQKFWVNSYYNYVGQFGQYGTGNGQFSDPCGIAISAEGSDKYIYVVDRGNRRVQKFWVNSYYNYVNQLWSASDPSQVQIGIAVSNDNYSYISDTGNHRVQKFDASGGYISQWGSLGSGDGQFNHPGAIAFSGDGSIFVVDSGNDRVQKFNTSGQFIGKCGSYGSGDGQFNNPSGIAVSMEDGNTYVYVVDSGNNRVQKFWVIGGTLNYAGQWGSYGSGNGQFDRPTGIAVSGDGSVYVVDTGNQRIQKFNIWGGYVSQWGSYGSGNGQFDRPDGIAASSSGNVYVVDSNNNRIQIFDLNGIYRSQAVKYGNYDFSGGVACGANMIYVVTTSLDYAIRALDHIWTVQLSKAEATIPKASRVRFEYDAYGNVLHTYVEGDLSTSNDDMSIHSVFYPNTDANIMRKSASAKVYATITCDVGGANLKKETHYYYDGSNTSLTTPPTKGNLTRLEQKKDASSSVSSYFTYDIYGNRLTSQDPNGNITTLTFDTTYHTYPQSMNYPIAGLSESYIYEPGTKNLLSLTDVNGQTTTSEYDTFKRLTKTVKPGDSSQSPSIEYQYNNWGTLNQQHVKVLTKISDGNYLWQSNYFDGIGRIVQTQAIGETGRTIISSTTAFNNRGLTDKQYVSLDVDSAQVNGYKTPEAAWKYTSPAYDGLSRVTTQINADGTTISNTYSNSDWLTTVTNQRGFKKRNYYDFFSRLVKVEELDASQAVYSTTNYAYDVLGNLVQVKDNSNNTISVTYDWLSRKTAMTDPDMASWSYSYDNNGNLTSQTDAKNQTITLTYDALNRLTAKYYPQGSNMTDVGYTYDSTDFGNFGKGNRTGITDAAGNTNYKYDARGRLTEEKRNVDSVDYDTGFAYDAADRLTSLTYPTGETVTNGYNGHGLPYSLSGSAAGNLVTSTLYNGLGLTTESNLGNGTRTTYGYWGTGGSYDTTGGYYGRLWEIKTSKQPGDNPVLMDVKYAWDAGGNLTQRENLVLSDTFPDPAGTGYSPTSDAIALLAGWSSSEPESLAITTTSLLGGNVGTAYSQTLQATGGSGSYTWSITSGSLPTGLNLTTGTGVISGTPSTAGTSSFTVQVNDGSTTASQPLSITINSAPVTPWLSGWGYRKQMTVAGSTAGAQTNYQMKLIIHRAGGSDNGRDVYVDPAKCDSTYKDIRFTKSDGTYLLDYWIESSDANSATVWIEFDSISASPATSNFYLYYGNAAATSISSGTNTFMFFDDFPGSSVNTDKWNASGTPSVASSIVTFDAGEQIYSNSTFGTNIRLRAKVKTKDFGASNYEYMSLTDVGSPWYGLYFQYSNPSYAGHYDVYNGSHNLTDLTGWSAATWHVQEETRNGPTDIKCTVDDTNLTTLTTGLETGSHNIIFYSEVDAGVFCDWIFISNYTANEPTWGTWDSEEIGSLGITTTSLLGGNVGTAYSQTLQATGGSGSYTWSITSGSLPTGLNLTTGTGVISGTPSTAGTSSFTVQVNDGSITVSQPLSITINSVPVTPWLSGWAYRKQITINHTDDGAQANYQMKLTIVQGSGVDSGGTVYLGNHALDWPEDIRFATSDGTTLLDFWREEADATAGTWWVEFNSIPSHPDNGTFYLYYGDADAIDESDGVDTFDFFDHFPWSSIDGNKWTYTSGVSVNDSICTVAGSTGSNYYILGKTFVGVNHALRARVKSGHFGGYATYEQCGLIEDFVNWNTVGFVFDHDPLYAQKYQSYHDGSGTFPNLAAWSVGAYHTIDIKRNGTTNTKFYTDDANETVISTNVPDNNLASYFLAGKRTDQTGYLYVDWVVIRHYTANEPTWGTWGNEESALLSITTTTLANGTAGAAYSQTLQATGGSGSYSWSVTSGSLPGGINLTSGTGVISGTPSTAGTSSFTVQVNDGSTTASQPLSISISNGGVAQKLIGAEASATPDIPNAGNYFVLSRFTATASGDMTAFKIRCSTTGNVKVAIYADSSGEPGALLKSVDTSTPVNLGWNTIPIIPSIAVISGTNYWLAFCSDGNIVGAKADAGYRRYKPATFSSFTFPSTPGTDFTTDTTYYDLSAGWTAPVPVQLFGTDAATVPTLSNAGNYLVMSRFTASASGELTEFRVRCSATGNVKVAIYADSSGEPGNLLNGVSISTPVAADWNNITLPSTTITSGTNYWLAFCSDGDIVGAKAGTGYRRHKPATFSSFTFPSIAGTDFTNDTSYYDLSAGWGTIEIMPLDISTTSLPNGNIGIPYSQTLQATGGSGSYSWSITSGSLQTGLNLAAGTGVISGTPSTVGTSGFTVQVNDGSTTANQPLSITIDNTGTTQKLIGADDATANLPLSDGNLSLTRFQAAASGNVVTFKVKSDRNANVKVAIYEDINGEPGELLNANNTSTPIVAGWNEISIDSTPVIADNYYWLAINSDTTINCATTSSGGTIWHKAATYSTSTETFSYDFLDRLTSASGPYGESYTYDPIGNITSKGGLSYTYGTKPHAVTKVGSTNYDYDSNGNMTTRGSQTLTWDAENRLIATSDGNAFVYDGCGNRIKKTEGGDTILYINRYYEKNLTTGVVTTNYYLGSQLVAQRKGNDLQYIHQDHLDGTSVMSDSSGNQIGAISYYPFGAVRAGSVPTDKKFTGQQLDSSGLYYYGARYYDPIIGRFISADTFVQWSDGFAVVSNQLTTNFIPQCNQPSSTLQVPVNTKVLNRYSYVINNPLRYNDPYGWWTWAMGLSFTIGYGLGLTGSITVAQDGEGNLAIVSSGAGGVMVGSTISLGVSTQVTSAPTVTDLSGQALQIGFSFGGAPNVAIEGIATDNGYWGEVITFGAGPAGEAHWFASLTEVIVLIDNPGPANSDYVTSKSPPPPVLSTPESNEGMPNTPAGIDAGPSGPSTGTLAGIGGFVGFGSFGACFAFG